MSPQKNPCLIFFKQFEECKSKAEELAKTGKGIDWESLQASEHSPGPVQNEEHVARLVVNPIHIDPSDGSLKPSLMSDVKDKGGSVQRLAHLDERKMVEEAAQRMRERNMTSDANRHRSVHGTVTLSVEEIRRITTHNGYRAFGVYDTARADDQAHADILMLTMNTKSQEARSARQQLFVLASEAFKVA